MRQDEFGPGTRAMLPRLLPRLNSMFGGLCANKARWDANCWISLAAGKGAVADCNTQEALNLTGIE